MLLVTIVTILRKKIVDVIVLELTVIFSPNYIFSCSNTKIMAHCFKLQYRNPIEISIQDIRIIVDTL